MRDSSEQPILVRSGWQFALRAGLVATFLSAICFWYAFSFYPFENDDASYLFQATLYLLGRLSSEPPPSYEFNITFFNLVIEQGRQYSQYPYGHPLALAIGLTVGQPWIVPTVSTGALVILVYFLSDLLFGRTVARLAAALAAISPAVVGMGSTYFSETTSRFMLGLFVLLLLRRFYRNGELTPNASWFEALVGGVALGFAFNTRPMTAAAFGIVAAMYVLLMLVRLGRRAWPILTSLAIMGLATVGMIETYLLYNKAITGDPLDSPYPFTGIGFEPDFTVHHALQRAWRISLPYVTYHLTGLGALTEDPYRTLLPYSNVYLGGLLRGAPGARPDCDLTVWGMDNGFAQVVLNSGPRRIATLTVPEIVHGRGSVELGLWWTRSGCTGQYRLNSDSPWIKVGDVEVSPLPSLAAGVYSGLLNDAGSGAITFAPPEFESGGLRTQQGFLEDSAGWIWKNADPVMVSGSGELRLSDLPRLGFEPGVEVGRQVVRPVEQEGAIRTAVTVNFLWRGKLRSFLFDNPVPWLIVTLVIAFVGAMVAYGMLGGGRMLEKLFLLAMFGASLLAYSFVKWDFWSGSILPPRTRYLNEATVLGILPLYAHGLARAWQRMYAALGATASRTVLRTLAVIWVTNIIYTQLRIASIYEASPLPGKFVPPIPEAVKAAGITNGVIIVDGPGRSALPLGDYPFEPLADANLIYVWYPAEPWETFVARHFSVEKPVYLWRSGELRKLR